MIQVAFTRRCRALIGTVVAAVLLTSCSYFLGPDDELNAEVSFEPSADAGQDLADSASIALAENRRVAIVGAFTTSDACRELNGEGSITQDVIEIILRADADPLACPGVLGRFDYEVVVSGIRRGTWTVLVKHRRYGEGDVTFVASKSVVVP